MTAVLLDISAYSAFMRGDPEVKLALQQAEEVSLSPVILGELLSGFRREKHTKKNEQELATFTSLARVTTVKVDEATAERYAVTLNSLWKAGTPIPTNDIWISATAMQYGLRLLTTDAHFRKVSQIIVDCFPTS